MKSHLQHAHFGATAAVVFLPGPLGFCMILCVVAWQSCHVPCLEALRGVSWRRTCFERASRCCYSRRLLTRCADMHGFLPCRWCQTGGCRARRCCLSASGTSSCRSATRRPPSCWTCRCAVCRSVCVAPDIFLIGCSSLILCSRCRWTRCGTRRSRRCLPTRPSPPSTPSRHRYCAHPLACLFVEQLT